MMGSVMVRGLSVLALLAAGANSAAAEATCSELLAPTSLSLRDTGLDQPRAACAADTVNAGARAFVLVDKPEFYGTLSGSLFLDYRILHATGFEFGIGARVVDYRFAQTAVFTADEFAFGPIHVDALRPENRNWFGKSVVLSHAIRLELPLTNTSDDNFTLAVSPSVMASMFLSEKMHLHGRVAGLLWSVLADSGPDSRAALLSSVDLSYAPLSFASLLVGGEVQGGWYGVGLDHLQARAGIRIAAGSGAGIELSAGTALLGSERADIVTWLGYRRSTSPTKQNKPSRLQDWAR